MTAPNRQQPNWGIILQALQGITAQAALIPNLPVFDHGNQTPPASHQLSQTVAALRAAFRQGPINLRERQVTLEQELTPLRQGLVTIQHELSPLQQEQVTLRQEQAILRQGQDTMRKREDILQPQIATLEQQQVDFDQRVATTQVRVDELQEELSRQ